MRRMRALTFIELIVVVAIIGLLIALLLPSMSHGGPTKRGKCLATLRSLSTAYFAYETENSSVAIHGTRSEQWLTDQSPALADALVRFMPPAIPRKNFYCPISVSQDPEKLWRPTPDVSIWGYVWLNDRGPDSPDMPTLFPARTPPIGYITNITTVKKSSETILALDQIISDSNTGPMRFDSIARPGFPDFSTSHPTTSSSSPNRYTSVLFADGHVDTSTFDPRTATAIRQGGPAPTYIWIPAP